MIQDRLWIEVEKVADRYQRLRFWRVLAVGWVVATMIALLLSTLGIVSAHDFSAAWPALLSVAVGLVVICAGLVKASAPGHDWVARQIETAFPDLGSCLLAAIEQQPALPDGRFGFLQESVIRQALIHAACHLWRDVVPARRIATAMLAQFAMLVLFALTLTTATFSSPAAWTAKLLEGKPPTAAITPFSVTVEPGDTEIERGSSLLVLARVLGQVPADATLVIQPAVGDASNAAMSRSLDDPVFGGRIAAVTETLNDGGETPPPRQTQAGQRPGQQRSGQQSKEPQPGQQPKDGQQPGERQPGQGGENRASSPISGEDFREWSDRLRDVEEMVDNPELRAEAARIRDQARTIRAEMKRHSKEPNWGLVRVNIAGPLAELANRVSDKLLRRASKQAIVPLDRDPVPPKYSEKTRRYYEQLGSGK